MRRFPFLVILIAIIALVSAAVIGNKIEALIGALALILFSLYFYVIKKREHDRHNPSN